MWTPETEIEKRIGRTLAPEERDTIPDLNELPPHLLADARELARESKLLAFNFVKFYAGVEQFNYIKWFIEDVVVGGQDPAHWGREPLLCYPSLGLPQLLFIDVAELLAVLQRVPGDRWFRLKPDMDKWDYSGFGGAPGVVNRAATYRWQSPERVCSLALRESAPLEPIEDFAVAARRWIASRLAWANAKRQRRHEPSASLHDVTQFLSPDSEPSADARIAVRGLRREAAELEPSDTTVPGFRGPDEWYRE